MHLLEDVHERPDTEAGVTTGRQRPGTATYATGKATASKILDAAAKIVVDLGMAKLSMRRLARELKMSPGHLHYYYKNKSDLLEDLCDYMLNPYLQEFERLRLDGSRSTQAQLVAVIEFVIDDLSRKETTCFFPELWVLSLRDEWACKTMEALYNGYRSVLREIIAAMRADLQPQTVADIALVISSSIEGHTVFIGHGRPHAARAASVKKLMVEQFLNMVRNATD